MRAIGPFPGVRLCRPGNVNPVQLVVTLSCPPGALTVGEEIPLSSHRGRAARHMFAWNAHRLIDVNHIGVRDVVVCLQLLPRGVKPRSYAAERIAARNHVGLVAAGTWGMRRCAKYVHPQSVTE